MVAGRTPFMARLRFPKKKKEEEIAPVSMARPNGPVVSRTRCWVMVSVIMTCV